MHTLPVPAHPRNPCLLGSIEPISCQMHLSFMLADVTLLHRLSEPWRTIKLAHPQPPRVTSGPVHGTT